MDWNQSTMYEQRVRFILEVQQRTFSFAESCRRYGISRTAGYTWWTRFLAEGFEGLHDRSHRPHHCPHAVAEPIVEHVVDLRQRYGWGSRKIRKLTAVKFGSAPVDPLRTRPGNVRIELFEEVRMGRKRHTPEQSRTAGGRGLIREADQPGAGHRADVLPVEAGVMKVSQQRSSSAERAPEASSGGLDTGQFLEEAAEGNF